MVRLIGTHALMHPFAPPAPFIVRRSFTLYTVAKRRWSEGEAVKKRKQLKTIGNNRKQLEAIGSNVQTQHVASLNKQHM